MPRSKYHSIAHPSELLNVLFELRLNPEVGIIMTALSFTALECNFVAASNEAYSLGLWVRNRVVEKLNGIKDTIGYSGRPK